MFFSMRVVAAATTCVAVSATGCASDREWFPGGGVLSRKSLEVRKTEDDAKCRELGFESMTDAYVACRLRLIEIRNSKRAANRRAQKAHPTIGAGENGVVVGAHGKKVYDFSECIGPVVMGECKGSIIPNKAYHPTCYGEWLNGQCTGPMF